MTGSVEISLEREPLDSGPSEERATFGLLAITVNNQPYMDAPLSATGNLSQGSEPAVGRCRISGLSDAALAAAGPHGLRGPDPKRLPGLEALRAETGSSGPVCPTLAPALSSRSRRAVRGPPASRPGGRGGGPEFSPSSVSSFSPGSRQDAAMGRQASFFTESAHTVRAILFARATAATLNGFSSIILRSQGSAILSRPLWCRSTRHRAEDEQAPDVAPAPSS